MHGHAKRNGTKRHCVSYSIITSHGNPWLFHALIKTIMYILAVSNSNFLYTRHADLYSNVHCTVTDVMSTLSTHSDYTSVTECVMEV